MGYVSNQQPQQTSGALFNPMDLLSPYLGLLPQRGQNMDGSYLPGTDMSPVSVPMSSPSASYVTAPGASTEAGAGGIFGDALSKFGKIGDATKSFFANTNSKDGSTVGPSAFSTFATGASSLLNGYLGMKQYGLAKKSLAENTRQFNMNYENQRKTTNTSLRDRQIARNSAGGGYMDTDEYMRQNGI